MNRRSIRFSAAWAARCLGAPATLAALLGASSVFAQSSPPHTARTNVLDTGKYLTVNQYMPSPNKSFFAILQTDGNFCIYKGKGPTDNHGRIWCSGSNRAQGAYYAQMQGDGNFCIYKGTGPKDSHGNIWCTASTALGPGNYFATMPDDNNFQILKKDAAGRKQLAWRVRAFRPGDTQYNVPW